MDKMSEAQRVQDALNSGPQPSVQGTWVVMLFGSSQRPTIACSTSLDLALTHFYALARMVVTLLRDEEYRLAGDDDDAALRGFSLFIGKELVLVLQPAGSITPHPVHAGVARLVGGSFEKAAPAVLAALGRRKDLGLDDVKALMHSTVAIEFSRDIDEPIQERSISEDEVREVVPRKAADLVWKAICESRTMLTYAGVVSS